MSKFIAYDFATKGYIAKLQEVLSGDAEMADLIPAAASVQNAYEEIRDFSKADRDYTEATAAYIKGLASQVKGTVVGNIEELEASYSAARRRVIVDAPVTSRPDYEAA
jgi:hypothetical protein